mmetsp:Transcript_36247/g.43739  ORF Transcript_36247/g.43739 Transcript_36247/m.43739 type:complete len:356 (+) Transcript_36247:111-1178(+)|eukprot:CAMPEP_0197850490 /NCGR_PEP_ID=MMETSP1438-20131217/15524_1 /TAXON_ID=1461541 /ORGANISM="Pterosperma sp., Strain CCMP1384" /LENGTH=355 /DNA_ID=CAMNT_0043463681 /DNA_START=111 /DNA_END=1178 /DNA_ORIENTATION=+
MSDSEYGTDDYISSPDREKPEDKVIVNQPHDEEVTLSDDDETDTAQPSPMVQHDEHDEHEEEDEGDEDDGDSHIEEPEPVVQQRQPSPPSSVEKMKPEEEDSSDDGDDKEGHKEEGKEMAGYNAEDYNHLQVSEEVRELFQYIDRYEPQTVQLDSKLKPFIPDYIPAIGDIDEFIKVARPDGTPDDLGLKVLDEPCSKQSDPTVLNLQLRSVSKKVNLKPVEVSSIEGADKDPKKIAKWIASIQDLHKNQSRSVVSYSKNMPDIETLMEEWPPEIEDMLNSIQLPDGELDLPIDQYCKVLCNLLDIPVYNNTVESLHVMFTLYLEFKNNPYLKKPPGMGVNMNDTGGADVFTMED